MLHMASKRNSLLKADKRKLPIIRSKMGVGASKTSIKSSTGSKEDTEEESLSEEARGKVDPFDRESTGTSGYSSYGCEQSTLNSTTGQKLLADFENFKKGLNEEDRVKILRNFRFLKGELDPAILSDYFIRDGLFKIQDSDEIQSDKPRHKQVDIFLRKLLRLEPEAYQHFLQYLTHARYKYVCPILEEPNFIQALNHEDITNEDAKEILTRFQDQILDQLEPEDVADVFVEYEEFSIDEYEEIIVQNTRRSKSKQLLDLLLMHEHTQRAFLVLMQALRETDERYLLKLLQGGVDADQCRMSQARYDVDTNATKAKVKEAKRTTRALKDSEQCQITIKIKSDQDIQQLEVDITQEMNKCDVKLSINNNMILNRDCLITSVEHGSILIVIKGCRPCSMKKMFDKGVSEPVLNILRQIFLHPNIEKILLPRKELHLDVTIKCVQSENEEKETHSDIIKSHIEFLEEELDALTFLKLLEDKHILSKDEVHEILEETPTSRKTRTRAMISKILEKERADDFVDMLKDKKRYIWEHVFQSKNSRSHALTRTLVTSYNEIADNMSPTLILEHSSLGTMIQTRPDSTWRRDRLAKYILQQVLMQDFDTKLHLIYLLRLYEQIPPEIKLQRPKKIPKTKYGSGQATGTTKTESIEVQVGDFVVALKENKGRRRGKTTSVVSPRSVKQSLTRHLDKTTRKNGRGSFLTYTKRKKPLIRCSIENESQGKQDKNDNTDFVI